MTDPSTDQREREVLNTLATMPALSKATILGVKVSRFLVGFRVEDGPSMRAKGAARKIVRLAAERAGCSTPTK